MTASFRAALLAALTAICAPSVAVAQNVLIDSLVHRIDSLEHRTDELERRVSILEARLGAQPLKSQPVPISVGSPSLAKWRRLSRGMNTNEVSTLLGEPNSVNASGQLTIWYYPDFAYVTFRSAKVDGWSEPHR